MPGESSQEITGFSARSEEAVGDVFRVNIRSMLVALVVGVCVMGLKFFGYWITGSSAILSDALESIINIAAGAFALGSLLVSARPPDDTHPYGHGKIEYFSAGFEGALIVLAALGIFTEGIRQIVSPNVLPRLESGAAVTLVSTLVNLFLAVSLIRTGRRTRSVVLVADGKHIMSDVYTSGGIVAGLGLVHVTGWFWLDGALACLMGLNILVSGFKLVREAVFGLMDASDPRLLEEICDLLEDNRKDIWIDVHKLRAWRSGSRVHVDFHLILPRDLPLEEGHREVKELEEIFYRHFRGLAEILIHLDPCADPECPVCAHDPCDMRNEAKANQRVWRREDLTCDADSPPNNR